MYQEMPDPSTYVGSNSASKFRRPSPRLRGQSRTRNDYNYDNMQMETRHDPYVYSDYQRMDEGYGTQDYRDNGEYNGYDEQDGYNGNNGYDDYDGIDKHDNILLQNGDRVEANEPIVKTSPSSSCHSSPPNRIASSPKGTPTSILRTNSGKGPNLNTSDLAFQMTAKLVVDYLTPKLDELNSSYYLDDADTMFLEAVIPEEIRQPFVKAVSYRAASIASGNHSPLESLVNDCQKLGLGQDDCFFLGGGTKMRDGRILIEVRI